MQTNGFSSLLISCCACVLLLSGCLDITSTSQVNSNGSIVRTITFTGDSAGVYGGNFPVELDSSWSRSIAKSPGKDKNFTLTAIRVFQNADEMNRVLKGTFGRTLQYRFELDKSFRWFFTVFRYREVNLPFDQFTSIPMTEFVSRAELDWMNTMMLRGDSAKELATRGDSLAFESIWPRLQEWQWRNRFEPVFKAFLGGVRSLNNSSLTTAMVEQLKDSLYKRSAGAIEKGKIDNLPVVFAVVLKNPAAYAAWKANASGFDEIKRRVEFEQTTDSHKFVTKVAMPGIVTGSNAREVEGNVATWRDFKDYAHHTEYTMWVESRQVNWWAVGIAGVVVACLLTLLLVSMLRRRRRI
ncbi:MAG: hypothetical protein NTU47_01310 [Ignavibacteriales bacterium]|nr:hypothetical protein [Ignavibacteriales bacterium]